MAILLEIKAVPQSGRQQFVRDKSGMLKCFLKSAAEDGKANDELIKFLSITLSIPQENIKILQGATSRKKVIKIETAHDKAVILHKLGFDNQLSI